MTDVGAEAISDKISFVPSSSFQKAPANGHVSPSSPTYELLLDTHITPTGGPPSLPLLNHDRDSRTEP